ncbi:MAG: phasin family protein [Candidatus Eremiobacterota bacterium]
MNATKEMKNLSDSVLDTTMQMVSNALWAQEQADKFVESFIEHRHATRDEGKKMLEKMNDQIKHNQEALQRFVHASVNMSLAAMRIPMPGQIEAMERKIEELTRELNELRKSKG